MTDNPGTQYVVYYKARVGQAPRRIVARSPLRVKGHKLSIRWSGEYGGESSSTGTCPCGWTESGSNQDVVRDEYRHHLTQAKPR